MTRSVTARRESSPLTPQACPFAPLQRWQGCLPKAHLPCLPSAKSEDRRQPPRCSESARCRGHTCAVLAPARALAPSLRTPALQLSPSCVLCSHLRICLGPPGHPTQLTATSTGRWALRVLGAVHSLLHCGACAQEWASPAQAHVARALEPAGGGRCHPWEQLRVVVMLNGSTAACPASTAEALVLRVTRTRLCLFLLGHRETRWEAACV